MNATWFATQARAARSGHATAMACLALLLAGMLVLDARLAVGGLTESTGGNGARIARGAGGQRVDSVRLDDLVRHGDVNAYAPLPSGGVVAVPRGGF